MGSGVQSISNQNYSIADPVVRTLIADTFKQTKPQKFKQIIDCKDLKNLDAKIVNIEKWLADNKYGILAKCDYFTDVGRTIFASVASISLTAFTGFCFYSLIKEINSPPSITRLAKMLLGRDAFTSHLVFSMGIAFAAFITTHLTIDIFKQFLHRDDYMIEPQKNLESLQECRSLLKDEGFQQYIKQFGEEFSLDELIRHGQFYATLRKAEQPSAAKP